MQQFIIIGPSGCGKTTLCGALYGPEAVPYHKTQMVEAVGGAIDTPGEYLENPRLYRALAATMAQAKTVLLMQACNDGRVLFPPWFAGMFGGKPVYGVVGKMDLLPEQAQLAAVEENLLHAGAQQVLHTSGASGQGLQALRELVGTEHQGVSLK